MEKRDISDKEVVRLAQAAVKLELQKKEALGIPAVVYDRNTQMIYEISEGEHKGNRRRRKSWKGFRIARRKKKLFRP